jgi:uncharacterized protein YidB (DUF937 family)/outer membrane protein OmpA-like peptidoglycan-associated protein
MAIKGIAMWDSVVSELASRFGLGEQAAPLLRQTLAYASRADHGGLEGFISKFDAAGLGAVVRSWLGGAGAAEGAAKLQSISPAQLETVLGQQGGLISQLVAGTGVARQTVTPALAYALPALLGTLTPDGKIPSALPAAAAAFLAGTGTGVLGAIAAPSTVAAPMGVGEQMARWIPWLVLVLLALGVLGWCSQKPQPVPTDSVSFNSSLPAAAAGADSAASAVIGAVPSASSAASSAEAATATATTAPLGAGVLAEMQNDKPMLKVYFDVSRAQVAPEFAKVAVDVLAYAKDHPSAKVLISGFNDPTGNAVQNAKLAKQRAEAVRAALKAQGLGSERMVLAKPADAAAAAAAGANNAELRRVEVHVQ